VSGLPAGKQSTATTKPQGNKKMTAQLLAQRPTIKILLYTDDPNAITDGENLLGLGSMIERLKAHAPTFAGISVKWVSRSSDHNHHADNKLDVVMRREVEETGEPFDEIWFFGLHQANTERFSLRVFRGGPESELTPAEVDALDKWMKVDGGSGGGVLMTGDHNNPEPPNWLRNGAGNGTAATKEPELLGLGRAIGRCVPRAGELRKWEGPPSSRTGESFNTLASAGFQTDRVPQTLIHQLVNPDGEPDPHGKPHPLFSYRPGCPINVFPDHRHEGALAIPDLSNTAVWPVGPNGQPKPCVVAFGTDRQSGQRINLVSAYDGDSAGVGRIVADSSWHHYVNINLKGFPHPAPPTSHSDMIGQFYGNLAIWLAPLHKRRQMAQAMYLELADYTLLLEQPGDSVRTGEVAYSVLGRSTSPCEIHELLRAISRQHSPGGLPLNTQQQVLTNTEQETLGLVLDLYQKAMIRAERTKPVETLELESGVSEGVPRARSVAATSTSPACIDFGNESTRPREDRSIATITEDAKEWTIQIKSDSRLGNPPLEATLIFTLTEQNGVVTGEVRDGVANQYLSQVQGIHQPLPNADHWFMELEFTWGNVNLAFTGVTLETPETVLFSGRYRARAAAATAPKRLPRTQSTSALMAPGDGDTGSGTGQQT
jgi:hypothetical protein